MEKLRSVIIGCGAIFPMHAESIRQACKKTSDLVAVCDIKDGNLGAAQLKYNCAGYKDYKEMLDREKPDVVHICTPHYLHAEMGMYAAERGINIFLEKPMSINITEALKLHAKVNEKGVKLGISFQNRYNPSTQLAKKLISNGEMGAIRSAKFFLTWSKPDDYYLRSDWKGTWDKEGGGVVIDQAIHSFDILRYLFGSEVEYVDCTIANRMHEKVKVEDEAAGVIMFRSGAYVNFYAMNHYSYDDDITMELHCEKGKINIVKDTAEALFFKGWKKVKAAPKKSEYIDYGDGAKDYWGYCHSIAISRFYDAVIGNGPFEIGADEGLDTQWLIEAIYRSGKENKRVYLRDLKTKL